MESVFTNLWAAEADFPKFSENTDPFFFFFSLRMFPVDSFPLARKSYFRLFIWEETFPLFVPILISVFV